VGVAVVLVDVVHRVRVDDGGLDLLHDRADHPDGGVAFADVGVPQVVQVQGGAEHVSRPPRFRGPLALAAAPGATGECEDRNRGAHLPVGQQCPACADLDVVGMRADREHAEVAGLPRRAPPGDQGGRRRDQLLRPDRFLQELIGLTVQRLHRVIHRRVGGDHHHRQIRCGLAQRRQQADPGHARHLHVGDDQIPGLGPGPRQCGFGVLRVADLESAVAGQDAGEDEGGEPVIIDHQDAPGGRLRLVAHLHPSPRPGYPAGQPVTESHYSITLRG
jgi:hypothetical protein